MTGDRLSTAEDKEAPIRLLLARTLPGKLELLMKQREILFHQHDKLLQRQAVLIRQRRDLVERQTAHELQSRLFWLRLQRAASAEQRHEVEISVTSASTFTLPEFSARLLSGDTGPQTNSPETFWWEPEMSYNKL